jgi:hypothetical protein
MILKGLENDIILEKLLKHIFTYEYNVTYFWVMTFLWFFATYKWNILNIYQEYFRINSHHKVLIKGAPPAPYFVNVPIDKIHDVDLEVSWTS